MVDYLAFCLVCYIVIRYSMWAGGKQLDPFEARKKLEEHIESIEKEKVREFMWKFVDVSASSPAFFELSIVMFSTIPILNVVLLIHGVKNMLDAVKS